MPGGGTWLVQNKVRPGAYINFVAVPKPVGALGSRGIMTAALPMTWGPSNKLIELYSEDLLNGNSNKKVGCTAFDTAESLPFRLALSSSYKALLFRSDSGATKATAVLLADSLTGVAKYAGTTGNNITVAIVKDIPQAGQYEVQIIFKGKLQETFVVEELADFSDIESDWVDFVVAESPASTTIPELAGTPLAGATNGTLDPARYATYLGLLDHEAWQAMTIVDTDSAVPATIKAKIDLLRNQRGKKVQGVVYNSTSADSEGVIAVKQGYKTVSETVPAEMFLLQVASMTAGANVNQSNTAKVIPDATEIINPINEEDIAEALLEGWFVISYRQDGAVCVEQDINTFRTFTPDKGYAFSKNRAVRCFDEIGNTAALVFNRNYSGKVNNDSIGRNIYKAELISMMDQLQDIGAITNFEGSSDITVLPGTEIDSVVVDIMVQPVDSMEKLYMTVNVNA